MKTLKESILDQGWDYDDLDPKTKFEKALVDYFDTVKKVRRSGRLLFVDLSAELENNIYNFAKKYLKKISRSTAMQKNKCVLRIVVVDQDGKDRALQLSFDNNPGNEYIGISMACMHYSCFKPRLLSIHGQRIECFAIEPHTFKLLKFLIDNK